MARAPREFDKYWYYRRAVQAPDVDCEFFYTTYKELRGARARSLREDFCGTFAICCEWVRRHRENQAVGIDLDNEPLDYGVTNYLSQLTRNQQHRIQVVRDNVLTADVPKVDMVIALNFSYYFFKSRLLLRRYFSMARKGLKPDGVFIVDCFGGKDCQSQIEEKTRIGNFFYYWDQTGFDPVTNEALFYIHFKRKGERKREKVFTYDWRMWTIPEIREVMREAGFRRTHVYWEGTTRTGRGDGIFKRVQKGEECDAWVAYVVGEK
ncbi:MAG: class I SAM-dependent methyltransferase [Bdellovibrionales bacterium]